MNWFLSFLLAFWTIGTAFSISLWLNETPPGNQAWPVLVAIVNLLFWCVACGIWAYFVFARKTYRLGEASLVVSTRVLIASSSLEVPRETITHLRQVKDGGEGEDSFPSWGLEVNSGAVVKNLVWRILTNDLSGSNVRYRSMLRRQPYDQSRWLGIVIAKWANVEIEFCAKPE